MSKTCLYFLSVFFLTGCCTQQIYYTPSTNSDIGLNDQGDLLATVNLLYADDSWSGSKERQINPEYILAYSPIKNLGAYISYQDYGEFYRHIPCDGDPELEYVDTFRVNQDYDYLEYGLGYYLSDIHKYSLEAYLFYGQGSSDINAYEAGGMNYEFQKWGILGSMRGRKRNLEFGFGSRLSRVNFFRVKENMVQDLRSIPDSLQQRRNIWLLEPSMFWKVHADYFNLNIEMGLGHNFDFENQFLKNDVYFSVGARLKLHRLIRRIKQS